MRSWPGAYPWHDTHPSQHYLGSASGGVLISSRLRKDETPFKHPHVDGAIPDQVQPRNDQAAGVGVKTYAQFALPFGHIDHEARARGGTNLNHYDYNGKNDAVNRLVADHGFKTYYAGGKYGKPDLANRHYGNGHLMVFDPDPATAGGATGFGETTNGDPKYTDSWRKTHELAHALSYPELNNIYGEGRRIGKLGTHRSLREALRAVHWEHLAAHKQRELNRSLGIEVPDEVFNKEYSTVMHDAVHRAVTGKFTEPSQEGFVPHSHAVPLETSLGLVREAARNMGLTGMHDLVKKSEFTSVCPDPILKSIGATAVADTKKSLTKHEALHELHKGLTAQVKDWEQKCLDLRKAELAKSGPRTPKFLNDEYKRHAQSGNHHDAAEVATALHHFHSEALHGMHGNHYGDHDPYHDKKQRHWHSVAAEHRAMAGLKKGDGMDLGAAGDVGGASSTMALAEKSAVLGKTSLGPKGAPAPTAQPMAMAEMKCTETPLCKCGSCSKMEKYAKGEMAMEKAGNPIVAARMAANKAKARANAAAPPPPAPKPPEPAQKTEVPAGSDPDGVSASGEKGKAPPATGGKKIETSHSREGGSDGTNTRLDKAALQTSAPSAAGANAAAPGAPGGAPKLPGAGAGPKLPKLPKLPGLGKPAGGGMPKPAAPAGGAKPPAMGAGQPALKSELNKAVPSGPPGQSGDVGGNAVKMMGAAPGRLGARDAVAQAKKLPAVRASVGNTMDAMLAGAPKPAAKPTTLPATPGAAASTPLAAVGHAVTAPAQGVQTMTERVAARMPAGQPGSALTPPPAHAKGPTLPGAHLFAPKPTMGKTELKKEHIGFNKLAGELAHEKGVENPKAVAAAIGRKKYGAKGMAEKAAKGK
jgi:hypothetical protein